MNNTTPIDPYRAAATLALTLISDNQELDDLSAADVAWSVYKDLADPLFQSENYCDEVMEAIGGIRAGRLGRIEPPVGILIKARELVGQSRAN
jgi:hypothetical protein